MAYTVTVNQSIGDATWRIVRSDFDFIDLEPQEFALIESGHKRRFSQSRVLLADGADIVGAGDFDSRVLQFQYGVYGQSDTEARANLNTIEGFFRADKTPYYLHDLNNGLRIEVRMSANPVRWSDGNRLKNGKATMTLLTLDPLWETIDTRIQPGGTGATGADTGFGSGTGTGDAGGIILTTGENIVITNSSNFRAFPVLTFTPIDSIVTFTMRNETTGGGFTFSSQDLLSGTVLALSSVDGSVTLDGVERSAGISSGGFIFLDPGENSLLYECENGSTYFQIEWRERSAF